jgi:5-methyltetrahydrofolate--homocysteine methyltransferase
MGIGGHLSGDSGRRDRGRSARSLFADAQKMLARIIEEKWLTARGVCAFWRIARR